MSAVRVVVCHPHVLVRAALRTALDRECNISTVGEAADASEAFTLSQITQPDVVLINTNLSGGGHNLSRFLLSACPRIVYVTSETDPTYLREAMKAGALGYVLVDSAATDLALAIFAAMRNERFISPALVAAAPGV